MISIDVVRRADGVQCVHVAPHCRSGVLRRWPTYRFAPFALDPRTRQLLREDREVHLSPKAFDVLAALVENRGRPMTRAELHEHIWPNTFVQDTNLAGLIAEVRRALADDADDPRFVRTVHRFGYWFIGAVESGEGAVPSAAHVTRHWLVWDTRQVALHEGANIVGRAPEATAWIDALGVSRTHARITIDGGDATIEDLGSKNGTFLHGERITGPRRLCEGDEIRLGSVVITFRLPGPPASTDSVMPA